MSHDRYPVEVLPEDDDDGTMPNNVDELRQAVVGHRIVAARKLSMTGQEAERYGLWRWAHTGLELTLDSGKRVLLLDSDDCCAYTALEEFFLDPSSVDHVILGVGTTEAYTTWHIYADFGDIMRLKVGWSPGNPFYYGYGFDIRVVEELL